MIPENKPAKIPAHVAFIMDGNGRWAAAKNLPRAAGHKEGAASVEAITNAAKKLGIKYITLYAFSSENWQRSPAEISSLMNLLEETLDKYEQQKDSGVRLIFSGRRDRLAPKILQKLDKATAATAANKILTVNLALNYGGRQEIADAFNKLSAAGKKKISEADISANLYQNIPDPDLIIRTAGEYRTSNFLLWESAYSELYISKKFWPDWEKEDLETAIADFSGRSRRFGGVATNNIAAGGCGE